jgi:hypothetical protein
MAVGDVYEVVLGGKMDGTETRNVLHFQSKVANEDPEALIEALQECIVEALLDFVSSGWETEFLSAKKIAPTAGPEVEWLMSNQGEVGSAAEPSFVAAVLSYHTAHAGRSGRGRSYVAGVPQASVVDGYLTESAIIALTTFVTCMVGKFISGTADFNLGVVSRKERAATPGTIANWFFPVTWIEMDTLLGTQRSRKIGRGM